MGFLSTRENRKRQQVYFYQYFLNNRTRKITFGPVGKRKAEEWYFACEALLRRGEDPRVAWDAEIDQSEEQQEEHEEEKPVQDLVSAEEANDLKTLIKKYISYSETRQNKPDTIKRKKLLLNAFAKAIDQQNIQQIKPRHLEEWISSYAKGKSPATIHGAFRELRAFFIWAERREYVLRSPHRALSDFRQPIPQPKEALTRAEIRQLIFSLTPDTDLERAVIIALHTAMRLNEIVQLKWEDVDLESDLIQLKATKAGRRQSVPISTELKKYMLKWKSQGLPKPILFAHKSNLSQQYSKLRDQLGFAKEKTFHSLRRTAATQLLANGESMFYVSKLLRHSSVAVTEAYYAHVVPKRLKSTADTLALIIQRDV